MIKRIKSKISKGTYSRRYEVYSITGGKRVVHKTCYSEKEAIEEDMKLREKDSPAPDSSSDEEKSLQEEIWQALFKREVSVSTYYGAGNYLGYGGTWRHGCADEEEGSNYLYGRGSYSWKDSKSPKDSQDKKESEETLKQEQEMDNDEEIAYQKLCEDYNKYKNANGENAESKPLVELEEDTEDEPLTLDLSDEKMKEIDQAIREAESEEVSPKEADSKLGHYREFEGL